MMHVQRKIQIGCDSLGYYMNNLFQFKTDKYDTAFGHLNEEDQRIFYNRSMVISCSYSLQREIIMKI